MSTLNGIADIAIRIEGSSRSFGTPLLDLEGVRPVNNNETASSLLDNSLLNIEHSKENLAPANENIYGPPEPGHIRSSTTDDDSLFMVRKWNFD
jgi:hypothetical protein